MNESIDDLTGLHFSHKSYKALTQHHDNCRMCTKCEIGAKSKERILFKGIIPCDILIIGEAPTNTDIAQELPFTDSSGLELQQQLKEVREYTNVDPTIAYTNVLRCVPKVGFKYRKPTASEITKCSKHLLDFILICKPRAIITAGNTAASALARKEIYGPDYGNAPDIYIGHIPHPSAIINQQEKGLIDRKRAINGLIHTFYYIRKLNGKRKTRKTT